jgi:hypothetical protein
LLTHIAMTESVFVVRADVAMRLAGQARRFPLKFVLDRRFVVVKLREPAS